MHLTAANALFSYLSVCYIEFVFETSLAYFPFLLDHSLVLQVLLAYSCVSNQPNHICEQWLLLVIGLSESTVSLAWFPTQPRTLVAGQGQKFLRMYDLRGEFFHKSSHHFWSQSSHRFVIQYDVFFWKKQVIMCWARCSPTNVVLITSLLL